MPWRSDAVLRQEIVDARLRQVEAKRLETKLELMVVQVSIMVLVKEGKLPKEGEVSEGATSWQRGYEMKIR